MYAVDGNDSLERVAQIGPAENAKQGQLCDQFPGPRQTTSSPVVLSLMLA